MIVQLVLTAWLVSAESASLTSLPASDFQQVDVEVHGATVWRPVAKEGHYILGDVLSTGVGRANPPKQALTLSEIVAGSLSPPTSFVRVAPAVWRPVPLPGYVCLGDVWATMDPSDLLADRLRCVAEDLTVASKPERVDVPSVWRNGAPLHGFRTSTYIWSDSSPPHGRAVLKDALEGFGLATREPHATPDTDPGYWREIAERYEPIFYLHSDEEFMPGNIRTFIENTELVEGERSHYYVPLPCGGAPGCKLPTFLYGNRSEAPVYAIIQRVDSDPETVVVSVSYWIFFPFNRGKEITLPHYPSLSWFRESLGNHVGDWERVSITFVNGYPREVVFTSHWNVRVFPWGAQELELVATDGGTRPVCYIALGSHGVGPAAGNHYYLTVGPIKLKDVYERGTQFRPSLQVINYQKPGNYASPFEWMNFLGWWGNLETGCYLPPIVCRNSEPPRGPAFYHLPEYMGPT